MATTTRNYTIDERMSMLQEVVDLLKAIGNKTKVSPKLIAMMSPARRQREHASQNDFRALERALEQLRIIAHSVRPMDPFVFQLLSEELNGLRSIVSLEGRCFDVFIRHGVNTRPRIVQEIFKQLPALRQQVSEQRELQLELQERRQALIDRLRSFANDPFETEVALMLPRSVHWLLFTPLDKSGNGSAEHLDNVEAAFATLEKRVEVEQERVSQVQPSGSPKGSRTRSPRKAERAEQDRALRNKMRGNSGASGDSTKKGLTGGNTRAARRRQRRHGVAA